MISLAHFSIGFSDVLDIGATSVLIYYLLLLIRGTRAVQIMLGLFVLVIILACANLLHLLVLATVMQYILLGTAVTLPIVFQPELRRGLERIGRGGLFARDAKAPETAAEAIAVLAQAAVILSRSRIGGLIVVEQATGLQEWIESGTSIGGRLSIELLLTVFTPRTPLHDGAVIVRGAKIEAAGCFLPLSETSIAERHLGTRHRAALGISEQTDAVVVVISEQTGNISVARGGRLSREIEEEERLRKVLLACTRQPRVRRQARRGLLANLRTRLPRAQRLTEKLRT